MADSVDELELCCELSEIFLAGGANYQDLAKVVAKYDISYIKDILFNWVAPVLWFEFYSTTPEIWGYNKEWLWSEIQENRNLDLNAKYPRKIFIFFRNKFIGWTLKKEWEMLIDSYKKVNSY